MKHLLWLDVLPDLLVAANGEMDRVIENGLITSLNNIHSLRVYSSKLNKDDFYLYEETIVLTTVSRTQSRL